MKMIYSEKNGCTCVIIGIIRNVKKCYRMCKRKRRAWWKMRLPEKNKREREFPTRKNGAYHGLCRF
jgi:hypothetical protein